MTASRYGAISVYGPQIFELLGFGVKEAEYITLGNYIFYLFMMTIAWMTIDSLGRRRLMVWGSIVLVSSFVLLTIFGALVMEPSINVPKLPFAIPGIIILYVATSAFGIGWLPQPWLIPTEIYPSTARAKGAAISVVTWGFANFAVTFLSPIFFNNLKYWIFLIFAGTNAFAGIWTWVSKTKLYPFCPSDHIHSFTLLRPAIGPLKRMLNSSLTRTSRRRGVYIKSTRANSKTCQVKRRIQNGLHS